MDNHKYTVNQHFIGTVLSWVRSGEIAIPEIQRPFVWESTKVRDLMDSLYQGFPIGYLIAWQNPTIRVKDGTLAQGKKILIDGQQRVTALKAAILGDHVINKDYKRMKIRIAFHPLEAKFEVTNTAIARDPLWIPDISAIFSGEISIFEFVEEYCTKNPGCDRRHIAKQIENLGNISNKQVGLIELNSDLDIEMVTEIFIRINSQGVVLSQADFAMSKIAANETYGGSTLRKCIDYFCHMAAAPEFYNTISEVDQEFAKTGYFQKISWLKNETDDIYDPDYTDMLRVAFTSEFGRGRLSDLVSLLSGRNFVTKTYEEEIARESFAKLEKGVLRFINEYDFKHFLMIIRSAGFISSSLIRSQNTLNFAYIVYLKLKSLGYKPADIERGVRRWYVMSVLTGRYSSAPESQFDLDIRRITEEEFFHHLSTVEEGELSYAFWDVELVENLNSSVYSSPYFNVFLAAQVKAKDKGFLSSDITVRDLIEVKGDVHHVFPREYLKRQGLKKGQYNQIANYVYMQSEINIAIGSKAPKLYFQELMAQCTGGPVKYGGITNITQLRDNLIMNCIPESLLETQEENYEEFLKERRQLMAQKIKKYYFML